MYYKNNKLQEKISLLGFGCMRFPTLNDGRIDEKQTIRMLDIAIKSGVNYIDTAYPYHNGLSEEFLGRALKKYDRQKIYLATKLPIWAVDSKEKALTIFNEQLAKLQTNYFDFYLLHALDNQKFEKCINLGIIELCEQLQREGKIKYFGFSFHDSYNVFEKIINYRNWDFCQIQFNYMDTEEQAGLKGIKLCEERNIPNIIMEPLKGGSLTSFPYEIAKLFTDYNSQNSFASWGLRYVGGFKNVIVMLSGMSNLEQVQDNLNTINKFMPLNDEELVIIDEVVKQLRARVKNNCTNCKYCMPCPNNVNIPLIFKMWNNGMMYDNYNVIKYDYEHLNENQFPSSCIGCGLCETKCPQSINIINDLQQANIDLIKLQNK